MPVSIALLLLAIVQGLAEFLPISSSAHLVLAERALGVSSPGPALELYMHAGTLVTICLFYRRRIAAILLDMARGGSYGWRYALCVVISAIPAGVLYFLCGDKFKAVYDCTRAVGALMVLNGVLLLGASAIVRTPRGVQSKEIGSDVSCSRALAMGLGQALAILPGVSRSGTSIGAGRIAGMGAANAAEFSFLMSVPAIAGAIVAEAAHGGAGEIPVGCGAWGLVAAAVVSAAVGYAALSLVVRTLERGRFWVFGVYCLAAGALATILA